MCPLDFGFNIPHKVSAGSVAYKENLVEEPMFNQFNFFTKLFKKMEDCECYVRCEEEIVLWCLTVCFLFQSSHIAK